MFARSALIGLLWWIWQPLALAADPPDRVLAAAHEAVDMAKRLERAACAALVDSVADQALQAPPRSALAWAKALVACPPMEYIIRRPEAPVPTEQVVKTYAPIIGLLDALADPTPEVATTTMQLRVQYWQSLLVNGAAAQARTEEQLAIEPLLDRLRIAPGDTLAEAALQQWARSQYGNASRQAALRGWLGQVRVKLGDGHPLQLRLLAASAFANRMLGRPAEALADAETLNSLVQAHQAKDTRWRMSAASEYGLALADNGRLVEAMDQLLVWQALEQQQVPPRYDSQMRLNYNLASLAFEIGDDDAAVRYADESVRLSTLIGDERNATESLAGELSKAQAKLRRGDRDAVPFTQELFQRMSVTDIGASSTLFALGRLAERTADEAAMRWALKSIEAYSRLRWDPLHAERPMLPLMAAKLSPPGSNGRMRQLLRAASIGMAGRSGGLEALTWFAMGDERADSHPDQAIWLYKRGANVLQRLRQGLDQDDAAAQRLWLADHEPSLRRLVGLLIDRGRLVEAQQALRVLRDEEIREYQRRSRGLRQSRSPTPVLLTASERQLEAALAPIVDSVRTEVSTADARADAELDFHRRGVRQDGQVEAVLVSAEHQLEALLAEPLPLAESRSVDRSQAGGAPLPTGHARVLYFMQNNVLMIAVQRGHHWHRVSMPVTRVELARQVHSLRLGVASPDGSAKPPAHRLYRWLLAPVQRHLGKVTHIRLMLDGILRLVPFAALHDGKQWAGERWVFQVHDSRATPTEPPRQRHAVVLALGRSAGDEDHAALPAVSDELEALASISPDVRTMIGESFTAKALAMGLAASPSVVHLASHFVLTGAAEEDAYLLLGDGERIPLSRLRALPWQGVHLAVLSACDTGVAHPANDGRQAEGLAAALQQAGAANVLATLWPITDGSTAMWMRSFYRPWKRAGVRALPSADWVARVQREWLRTHAGTGLAHPHHWAGFVWMAGR